MAYAKAQVPAWKDLGMAADAGLRQHADAHSLFELEALLMLARDLGVREDAFDAARPALAAKRDADSKRFAELRPD